MPVYIGASLESRPFQFEKDKAGTENNPARSLPIDPFFSIIIVSLNGSGVISRALQSIRASDYESYEVILVDNGSTDNLEQLVKAQFPEVRLIQSPINIGFAGGNNLGLREANGDILVLLNDDTEVRSGWLSAWANAAREHPQWGILGCKLLYPDGKTIQHAGGVIEANALSSHIGREQLDDGRFDAVRLCDYVTGAAMAIRRDVLNLLGGLDEKYYPIYFEETDYCWQVRRIGHEVLYIPDCVAIHHESRTQGAWSFKFLLRYTRGRMRFLAKCYSKAELWKAARIELRWWFRRYSYPCYLPYLCGYAAALCQLPGHLRDRFPFHRKMESIARQKH